MSLTSLEVYLFRHPQVIIDEGICYGQTDLELHPDGLRQWKEKIAVEKKLINDLPDSRKPKLRILTSPSKRCRDSALILSDIPGFPEAVTAPEILEMNFGNWEMQSWENLFIDTDSGYREWSENWIRAEVPGGESYMDLNTRVLRRWEYELSLAKKSGLRRLYIVTHAGPIRVILSNLLGIPLENSFRIAINYGSTSKIKFSGELPSIEFVNTI